MTKQEEIIQIQINCMTISMSGADDRGYVKRGLLTWDEYCQREQMRIARWGYNAEKLKQLEVSDE